MRNLHFFPIDTKLIYILTRNEWKLLIFHIPTSTCFCFIDIGHSHWCKVIPLYCLIFISLTMNDDEHFICLLILYLLFLAVAFQLFTHFYEKAAYVFCVYLFWGGQDLLGYAQDLFLALHSEFLVTFRPYGMSRIKWGQLSTRQMTYPLYYSMTHYVDFWGFFIGYFVFYISWR